MKIFYSFLILFLSATGISFGQMQAFSLEQIRLKPSAFQNAQQVDLKYILALNPDKLLAPYLKDAGLPTKADNYGNWENIGLDGHIGGHYLSALAIMYAATGEVELKNRLNYMVSELSRCQKANGNGYVGGIPQGKVFWDRIHRGDIDGSGFGLNNTWVPLYNIHKLFAGLRDAYQIGGNQQARSVLIGLSDWFIALISSLSDSQIQQILKTEHGGINETFADVFEITQDAKYLAIAQKLSHLAILEPLLKKEDKLNGLHANTQIPKVIGFEKIAKLTANTEWTHAAQYFWGNVSQTRSVVFGGNSVREHFNPPNDFSMMLKSNQGPETCNSFNMLRLSKALFMNHSDPSYLDFYERTMYNHILSSQHPEKGGFVYFTPIRPNHYRVYSQPSTSMWCCVGSGIENHGKYGELIYSHTENQLLVNLFIASELDWSEKGIKLIQNTHFPEENSSSIEIVLSKSKVFDLGIRKPNWAKNFSILINGKAQKNLKQQNNYVIIIRKWRNGDKLSISFSTELKQEKLPDGSNWIAFTKGPIVLAAATSQQDIPDLFADDSRMGHETHGRLFPINEAFALIGDTSSLLANLQEVAPLQFRLYSLLLQPFYKIHDTRYQLYFQTFTPAEYLLLQEKRKQEEAQYLALEAQTVDKVNCGEQQPEVDHGFTGEKSFTGNEDGLFWRSTRDYISYKLQNKDDLGRFLSIEFLEKYNAENTSIMLNDQLIDNLLITGNSIKIPLHIKDAFEVKLKAKNNWPISKVHVIRVLR